INKFKEKIKDKDYLVTNLNEILRSQHFKNNKFNINILIFPYNRLSIVDENIYIGYLVFELAILKKRYILDDQKLINALKAISDQTRFKVLKLLKERTWYAQELAEELNLSSATLNHHLSLLLNDNLISIELQESDKKKIYYSLNQKAFQEIITILKKTF
ncbi:MAG TPA: winged helix-turn-helix transcriptional regulator, partial [Acholeplasmataceae bacterium]|nr:winged helix-turn-helix transcriptional regulator [Acholeplasmataceae bacterium]